MRTPSFPLRKDHLPLLYQSTEQNWLACAVYGDIFGRRAAKAQSSSAALLRLELCLSFWNYILTVKFEILFCDAMLETKFTGIQVRQQLSWDGASRYEFHQR